MVLILSSLFSLSSCEPSFHTHLDRGDFTSISLCKPVHQCTQEASWMGNSLLLDFANSYIYYPCHEWLLCGENWILSIIDYCRGFFFVERKERKQGPLFRHHGLLIASNTSALHDLEWTLKFHFSVTVII